MLKPTEKVSWRVLDSEAVVLDVDTGYYYTLNPTATFVWEMVVQGLSLSEIATEMVEKYDVDEAQAREDIEEQLQTWSRDELIYESE